MQTKLKSKLIFFLFIPLIITLSACDRSPLTDSILLGKITISNTDLPVKDAEIYLNDTLKTRSDNRGYYSISGLSFGEYLLEIKKAGYKTAEKMIIIEDTGEKYLNISMVYSGENSVRGKVTISNRANPSEGEIKLAAAGKSAPREVKNQTDKVQYKEGEIIVKYRGKISNQQKVDSIYNLSQLDSIKRNRELITRYKVPENKSIEEMIALLEDKPEVEWAKPNYIYWSAAKPGDEKYPEQWGPAAVNLEAAWDLETGSKQVTVAVLDTGIIMEHEEFISGDNVDDRGVSFAGNASNQDPRNYKIIEEDPVDRTPEELGGSHGTHVSGIIGARTNNTGVAGINWNINILPIKVLDDDGSGNTFDIAEGIYYAIDNNADIINLSLGGPSDNDTAMKLAIEEAHQNDIIIVASAGNNGNDELLYPAQYEECIGVGAVDENLELASYSHYGQELELVAPGSNILSSWGYYEQGNFITGYHYMTGTSMAAPYVSGVVALLLARGINPRNIRARLAETAVDLGKEGRDQYYGYGLVDAYAALLGRKLAMPYIFATTITEENGEKFMNIKSNVTTTDREGNYLLDNIKPDGEQLYIIGWRDVNKNYVVDEGDYFGKTPYDGQNEINLDISYLEKSDIETGLTVKDTSCF